MPFLRLKRLWVIGCLGALMYIFLATEVGLNQSLWFLMKILPGTLHIKVAHGCLLGSFSVKGVHYQSLNREVTISEAHLAWDVLSSIRQGYWVIKQLSLGEVNIKWSVSTAQRTTQWQSLLERLQSIRLVSGQIKQLHFQCENISARVQGTLGEECQLKWQIALHKLDKLSVDKKTFVFLNGIIQKKRTQSKIRLRLKEGKGSVYGWVFSPFQGHVEFNLDPKFCFAWSASLKVDKAIYRNASKFFLYNLTINLTGHLKPGDIEARLNECTFGYTKEDRRIDFFVPPIHMEARVMSSGDWYASLMAKSSQIAEIILKTTWPVYSSQSTKLLKKADKPIELSVDFKLHDLRDLQPLTSFCTHLKGAASLKLRIEKGKPHLTFDLEKAEVCLPKLGLKLHSIQAHAQSEKETLEWKGLIYSKDKPLHFYGSTSLNIRHFPTLLHLTGENICILNTPSYKINASPSVSVAISNKYLAVQGKLLIPWARFRTKKKQNSVIELTSDVIFVEPLIQSKKKAFPIHSNLNIELGKDVQLITSDLEAKLRGNLEMRYSPNQSLLAKGEVTLVNSNLYLGPKKLDMDQHSRLIYTNSPLDDPGLHISASASMLTAQNSQQTKSSEFIPEFSSPSNESFSMGSVFIQTKLGIYVKGTAKHPNLTLFAEPTNGLSQMDILSYLLTGGPSGAGEPSPLKLLPFIPSLLKDPSKKFGIINPLEPLEKLGIDLSIKMNTNGKENRQLKKVVTLVLGKQFSSKLYGSCHVEFDKTTVKLRYALTEFLFIQGLVEDTGTKGIDVLFQIEK